MTVCTCPVPVIFRFGGEAVEGGGISFFSGLLLVLLHLRLRLLLVLAQKKSIFVQAAYNQPSQQTQLYLIQLFQMFSKRIAHLFQHFFVSIISKVAAGFAI